MKDSRAESLVSMAQAQVAAGEAIEALATLRRAAFAGADQSDVLRVSAQAFATQGDQQQAIAAAQQAVRADPQDWRALLVLAQVLPWESEPAATAIHAAAELAPSNREVLMTFEAIATAQGDARSVAFARNRLNPRKPLPITELLVALGRIGATLAIGDFLLLISGMPHPAQLLGWFGVILAAAVVVLWLWHVPFQTISVPTLWQRAKLLVLSGGAAIVGTLITIAWSVLVLLGGDDIKLLTPALLCAIVAFSLNRVARRLSISR
jgi:tetratricopeptide (TPR) repeat protein